MVHDETFRAGMFAHHAGEPFAANPYDREREFAEWEKWRAGWLHDAAKRRRLARGAGERELFCFKGART